MLNLSNKNYNVKNQRYSGPLTFVGKVVGIKGNSVYNNLSSNSNLFHMLTSILTRNSVLYFVVCVDRNQ